MFINAYVKLTPTKERKGEEDRSRQEKNRKKVRKDNKEDKVKKMRRQLAVWV